LIAFWKIYWRRRPWWLSCSGVFFSWPIEWRFM